MEASVKKSDRRKKKGLLQTFTKSNSRNQHLLFALNVLPKKHNKEHRDWQ